MLLKPEQWASVRFVAPMNRARSAVRMFPVVSREGPVAKIEKTSLQGLDDLEVLLNQRFFVFFACLHDPYTGGLTPIRGVGSLCI